MMAIYIMLCIAIGLTIGSIKGRIFWQFWACLIASFLAGVVFSNL